MAKKLTATSYHWSNNLQVERYNRTLVTRLHHFVYQHQKNRNMYVPPLTSVYNMQTHWATGISPFKRIILDELPSAAAFDKLAVPANDMPQDVTPRNMVHWLQQRILLMKATVSNQLSTVQRRYKRDFDRNVWQEPTFNIRGHLLVDGPQLAALASDDADETANCWYNKLLRQASEPYRVISVLRHTVAIEEDGISNTVSINRLTLWPRREQVINRSYKKSHTTQP